MTITRPTPTGREISFADDEIIVSKTDSRGVITYANEVFLRVAGYTEAEILGQPHNVIRHPAMPRAVFRLLWSTLQEGREIFAYVINLTKAGDGYWVFAHVTPSYDARHQVTGYHSNRRVPYPDALPKVKSLYATLLAEERKHANPRAAADAGFALLSQQLAGLGLDYDQFVFGLSNRTTLDAVVP